MKRIFRMDADHPRKKTIQDACGLMLLKPNATRWNLVFLSVARIVHIMHEKGEGALHLMCNDLDLPRLDIHSSSINIVG